MPKYKGNANKINLKTEKITIPEVKQMKGCV